jgi:hypothetical protein
MDQQDQPFFRHRLQMFAQPVQLGGAEHALRQREASQAGVEGNQADPGQRGKAVIDVTSGSQGQGKLALAPTDKLISVKASLSPQGVDIVVAQAEVIGHPQLGNNLLERLKALRIRLIHQIPGKHHEVQIGHLVEMGNGGFQLAAGGIGHPPTAAPRLGHQVDI